MEQCNANKSFPDGQKLEIWKKEHSQINNEKSIKAKFGNMQSDNSLNGQIVRKDTIFSYLSLLLKIK
jgi:hypothetical protein